MVNTKTICGYNFVAPLKYIIKKPLLKFWTLVIKVMSRRKNLTHHRKVQSKCHATDRDNKNSSTLGFLSQILQEIYNFRFTKPSYALWSHKSRIFVLVTHCEKKLKCNFRVGNTRFLKKVKLLTRKTKKNKISELLTRKTSSYKF